MINWKVRIKNKNFWLALIPALLLLIQAVAYVPRQVASGFKMLMAWVLMRSRKPKRVTSFSPAARGMEHLAAILRKPS